MIMCIVHLLKWSTNNSCTNVIYSDFILLWIILIIIMLKYLNRTFWNLANCWICAWCNLINICINRFCFFQELQVMYGGNKSLTPKQFEFKHLIWYLLPYIQKDTKSYKKPLLNWTFSLEFGRYLALVIFLSLDAPI